MRRKPLTAAELQSLGGKARAAKLTKEQRSAIARKAASASAKVRSAKAKARKED